MPRTHVSTASATRSKEAALAVPELPRCPTCGSGCVLEKKNIHSVLHWRMRCSNIEIEQPCGETTGWFQEQADAFAQWIELCLDRERPEQLFPIILALVRAVVRLDEKAAKPVKKKELKRHVRACR